MLRKFALLASGIAGSLLVSTAAWASSTSRTPASQPLDPVLGYSTYVRLAPGARFGEALALDVHSAANSRGEVCVSLFDTTAERPPSVAKLAPDGSLAYVAELPISLLEFGFFAATHPVAAVAIDTTGNCYAALALPALSGGPTVAYVMKLDTTGQLAYTYQVGGSGSVIPAAIAVDSAGEAYLSGSAQELDFPTANAFQSTYGGGSSDGFLLKLDSSGSTLLFSTYFGGTSSDAVTAMALDSAGNVVVVGGSNSANFPLLGTAIATSGSTFIAKFTSSGTLSSSTFLPSTIMFAPAVALDPIGAAYVLSTTLASSFAITKVNSAATSIAYSYSAASTGIIPLGIAVDTSGRAYAAGYVNNPQGPLPFPMVAPIQSTFQGGFNDAFVFTLDPTGTNILFSTFLGGPGSLPGDDASFNQEEASSVNVDSQGNIYVSGITAGAFPIVNAADGAYLPFPTCFKDPVGGNCQTAFAFVSKISQTSATVLALPSSVDFQNIPVSSTSANVGILLANVGSTAISLARCKSPETLL
jgi:hypothetical protein